MRKSVGWGATFLFLFLLAASSAPGQQPPAAKTAKTAKLPAPTPEDLEFFEKKIRPVLAENCVSCHSGDAPLAGLRLDTTAGIKKGGTHGPVTVPGNPENSLLLRALRHQTGVAAMPPAGKLKPEQIADFAEWVKRGSPMPADRPAATRSTGFPLEQRRKHWAYQPVRRPAIPKVKNAARVQTSVDAFLLAQLEQRGLKPAAPADKRTLIRRITFDLTGLPPTPTEVEAFLADTTPRAYEKVVDRLLASPQYGERWARHWLDLVRYGESLGHEFDFSIFNAYQYRDYVIRAFNADVPYDRFVKEHLAGDLLAQPRRDPKTGINESILGTGFYWLGEGKHSPVDVRQEQADRFDNMIDVVGKTFVAQTIACARCHDHKFDPIPATDYYALYGMLKSSRYQQAHIDDPDTFAAPIREIDRLRSSLNRPALVEGWKLALAAIPDPKLTAAAVPLPGKGAAGTPLPAPTAWKASGEAFATPARMGELVLSGEASRPALGLMAREGAHSALRSRRLEGALRSPTFTLDQDFLHLRVAGQGGRIHIVVDNFLLIRDPIYGRLVQGVDNPGPTWRTVDVRMWKGHRAYIELSDSPVPNLAGIDAQQLPDSVRQTSDNWLLLTDATLSQDRQPPTESNSLQGKPATAIRSALRETLDRWASKTLTVADRDALAVLDALLRDNLLVSTALAELVQERAKLEAALPAPTRAVAMCDGPGAGEDEVVFVRGNHKTPGEVAPRLQLATCFTEKRSPQAVPTGSGRLQFANLLTSPDHPLTARVMVNRLWKHHFGVGLVPTTDDFGLMGARPSHPELLDWLASEFARPTDKAATPWSIKRIHRLLVLSSAYRMSSDAADPATEKKNPNNALLHRMNVRRLEAEAIRDSMLAVSGRLDKTLYGPSIYPHLPVIEGRGAPPQGPLDGNGRRTLYLAIRRNFPSPFLLAFDFPTPFTTIGRRTVSNVPAQALALMNGEFVRQQAGVWAERLLKTLPRAEARERLRWLYQIAFSRPPTVAERDALLAYLGPASGKGDPAGWTDLCHALFNLKEFVYVR